MLCRWFHRAEPAPDARRYANSHCYAFADGDAGPERDRYTLPGRSGHGGTAYTPADAHAVVPADTHTNPDAHLHANAYGDADSHRHADPHSHRHRDRYAHGDAYGQPDIHFAGFTHADVYY